MAKVSETCKVIYIFYIIIIITTIDKISVIAVWNDRVSLFCFRPRNRHQSCTEQFTFLFCLFNLNFFLQFTFILFYLQKCINYCFSTSYTWPTNPILEGKIEEGVEKEVERYVLIIFCVYFYGAFVFFLLFIVNLLDFSVVQVLTTDAVTFLF